MATSRLADSEVLADERVPPPPGLRRVATFFAAHDIAVERLLIDNGSCYRSRDFDGPLDTSQHTFTQPYRPATNGKAERFNHTLLVECAYARPWRSDVQRARALAGCSPTTITDTTPPSVGHPSAA